ncbi:MAG: helix-turn-helix transcriptional regulator [Alphaproteobacteria bacterium]|nr:helix-turn-helix transcriptional regulator [Alphaproteobacteria bacterium]
MRARGRPPTTTAARRYPNRLRELRSRCGLSQQAVAAAAGISGAYYGALERGDKRINAETAERLCKPLRCAAGDLLAVGAGISVPLTVAVAAAEADARPPEYDLPEPHERLQPRQLAQPEDCFAAELCDDSANLDFEAGTVLFVRRLAAPASIPVGAKVLARFYLQPSGRPDPTTTHEVLYGILDRNIVGDLVLITRTRNRLVPRHLLVQGAALAGSGFGERTAAAALRDAVVAYEPRDGDPAELLGTVVYAMGPL